MWTKVKTEKFSSFSSLGKKYIWWLPVLYIYIYIRPTVACSHPTSARLLPLLPQAPATCSLTRGAWIIGVQSLIVYQRSGNDRTHTHVYKYTCIHITRRNRDRGRNDEDAKKVKNWMKKKKKRKRENRRNEKGLGERGNDGIEGEGGKGEE